MVLGIAITIGAMDVKYPFWITLDTVVLAVMNVAKACRAYKEFADQNAALPKPYANSTEIISASILTAPIWEAANNAKKITSTAITP